MLSIRVLAPFGLPVGVRGARWAPSVSSNARRDVADPEEDDRERAGDPI